MREKLRGIRTPAWLTGLLRAGLEAALLAGLYVGVDALTTAQLPDNLAWLVFAAPFLVRTAEGYIDEIDPVKVRRRNAADKVS